MSKLGGGIVFNIDIFGTRLEERACNANVELNRVEINLKETFYSVHAKVLKTNSIVFVKKISELAECLEILDGISLGLLKKDVELVIPIL